MKKLFAFFLFVGMLSFLACGPSAEEKAAKEKKIQDSIATVKAKQVEDSIAMVAKAKAAEDSLKAKHVADSTAAAEEAAKKTKGGKKAGPAKKTEPAKKEIKAGQGKNAK